MGQHESRPVGPRFELTLAEYRARERQRAREQLGAAFREYRRAWRSFKRAGCDTPWGVPVHHWPKQVRLTQAIVAFRDAKEYLHKYTR